LIRGDITYGDLITMDPFNNTIVTFKITGAELKRLLVIHAPAVSGMRYSLDNGTLTSVEVNGQPVDDSAVYFGSSNSFLVSQANFVTVTDKKDTGRTRVDALIRYIEAQKVIHPAYDGRRVVK